jgi:hypothetical protein
MRSWRAIVVLCSVVSVGVPARAEMTVDEFLNGQSTQQTTDMNRLYIAGVIAGFGWYSGAIYARRLPELYCPPTKIALRPEQAIDIVARYRAASPQRGGLEVAHALLLSLMEVFPCNK